jgi:CheY-like chemotaxis protein
VRLAQVLANLLNNSAMYTQKGGSISLRAQRSGDALSIAVHDNGAGIAADELPRLFEMFARGGPTSTRHPGGLGIGLSLAQRLAQMHGGIISARSEGAGRGSEFTVRLPLAPVQAELPRIVRSANLSLARRRILVVDDNSDAADSLAMILEFLGADVRVAHDGKEALDVLPEYEPTVVLLDIGMPGMDGYEVARRIRAHSEGRARTLVALTGWGQEKDRQRVREAGFDHHLVKPAELGALQALLQSIDDDPSQSRRASSHSE